MKNILSHLLYLILLSVPLSSVADEVYCEFDQNKSVDISTFNYTNRDSAITLIFPKADNGILHRIDLRYDNLEYTGQHEIYTQLAFQEQEDGYEMDIHLEALHKPLMLIAIYHLHNCYSNIRVTVTKGVATVE